MPPRRMKLEDVPDYVEGTTGRSITKMTAHNWAKKGVRGITLRTVLVKRTENSLYPSMRLTRADWVDEFLAYLQRAF